MDKPKFVYAVFGSEAAAELAYEKLLNRSFRQDDVHALKQESGEAHELPHLHRSGIPFGLPIGLAAGGVGAFLLYQLVSWQFFARFSWIAWTIAGIVIGGVLGTLAGLGFWQDKIDFEDDHLAGGRVVVGVTTPSLREAAARRALRRAGAKRVFARDGGPWWDANRATTHIKG